MNAKKYDLILGFFLIIAGGLSCVIGLMTSQVQTIVRTGNVVLSGQGRAEFVVPVRVESGLASLDGAFSSNSGEDFFVFLTRPETTGWATADDITAFLNGSSSSTGNYLASDISECCSAVNGGPSRTYASLYMPAYLWGTPSPISATVMIFGYNKTSNSFPTVSRLVSYTITSKVPVPGALTALTIMLITGGITITIAVLLIVRSRSHPSAVATPETSSVEKKYCSGCGGEFQANQAFCDKCGAKQ